MVTRIKIAPNAYPYQSAFATLAGRIPRCQASG